MSSRTVRVTGRTCSTLSGWPPGPASLSQRDRSSVTVTGFWNRKLVRPTAVSSTSKYCDGGTASANSVVVLTAPSGTDSASGPTARLPPSTPIGPVTESVGRLLGQARNFGPVPPRPSRPLGDVLVVASPQAERPTARARAGRRRARKERRMVNLCSWSPGRRPAAGGGASGDPVARVVSGSTTILGRVRASGAASDES